MEKLKSSTVWKLLILYGIIGLIYSIGAYILSQDIRVFAYSIAGVILLTVPMIVLYYSVKALEYSNKINELRISELSKKIDKLNKTANIIDFGD